MGVVEHSSHGMREEKTTKAQGRSGDVVPAGKSRGALPEPVPINALLTSTVFSKVLVDFSNVFVAFMRLSMAA